jgi:hypothetical protein
LTPSPRTANSSHQVGDVAHHEQVAGVGLEQYRRIDARVGTGDHGYFRALAASHQVLDQRLTVPVGAIAIAPVTLH